MYQLHTSLPWTLTQDVGGYAIIDSLLWFLENRYMDHSNMMANASASNSTVIISCLYHI